MSRPLTTILITLGLIVSAAGAYAPAAHAQAATTNPSSSASVQTTAGANNPNTLPANPPKNAEFGTAMTWIMSLFAWLLGVAMLTLDNVVYYTVVTMGKYVDNLSAIGIAWRVLRDVGNIVLIFGFLAIGISTILNTDRLGYGTRMLPMLLVAAVFLNFSLFISEAIIDTGNLFATEFYTQINGGSLPQAPDFNLANISNEGISNKIMSQLGFQTIYGDARNNTLNLTGSSTWLIGFMGIILFLVAAFVIFSLAFVLVARFVVLILLIIVAPIGFAGLAVPKLTGMAKQWWEMLFQQTITAPVLLLLLYIALKVITDASFLTGFGLSSASAETAWTGFINNGSITSFGNIMLSFIVAMGLLLAVVISAKKMSAAGAGWATKTAGAATFGAVAYGLRSTAGSGSRWAAQRMRTSGVLNNTRTGRFLIRSAEYGAKSSFDVRGTKALKNLPYGGVDAGEAAKGGYQAARDRATKKHEEYVKATDAALDERNIKRGVTKEDEEKAVAAAGKLSAAEQTHTEAEEAHTAAAEKHTQHLEEIKKIEGEKVTTAAQMEERETRLKAARVGAAASETDLAAAKKKMEFAKENLDKVSKEVKDKSGKMKDAEAYQAERVAGEKKEQKLEYAESISGLSRILSGPGTAVAAKKIIKDAKRTKTEGEKLLDDLTKAVAKARKDGKSEGENPKPETAH